MIDISIQDVKSGVERLVENIQKVIYIEYTKLEYILAAKLAGKPPITLSRIKAAVNMGLEGSLAEGLALEAAEFGVAFNTQDRIEGVNAFLEKRKADWKGK